ncbi:MAG: hypothetical protein NW226_01495 [Microscillaceae bacterium]|nr:hypothetical protein [Microscillaceae bacterium]
MKYVFLGCIWMLCLLGCVERKADIEKMDIIHHSLEHTADFSLASNIEALVKLKEKVHKEGSSPDGLRAIKRAKEMHQNTLGVISYLDSLRKDLKKSPQSDQASVQKLLFREKKGELLAQKLNDYLAYILANNNDLYGGDIKEFFPSLTQTPKNISFTQLYFGGSPVIEALAFLEKTKIEVLHYEAEVLKKLGAGDVSNSDVFEKFYALAVAPSNSVVQGEDYEAEMFFTSTRPKRNIKVTLNGENVRIKDGIASISIPAQGIGKHHWKASIQLQQLEKDTTFHLEGKYEVIPK